MNTLILVILIFIFISGLIGFFISGYFIHQIIKRDTDLKEKMFLFSLPINDEENLNILDKMIQRELEIYQIYNFPLTADDIYVTEEDQNKMVKCILTEVLRKLSPIYLNKLKYIYNEEVMEDIIYQKIRDAVLNFTVEINGQFNDKKK